MVWGKHLPFSIQTEGKGKVIIFKNLKCPAVTHLHFCLFVQKVFSSLMEVLMVHCLY